MPAPQSAAKGPLRFGVFELDPRTGELRKHGLRIKLQDQPLHVLQILLEKPGEMVTREDLRRLWPSDTFVDFDKGIYNAIKRLRETLGDTAETPRFIETLPKRGYRFVGRLENGNGKKPDQTEGASYAELAQSRENEAPLRNRKMHVLLTAFAVAVLVASGVATWRWLVGRKAQPYAPDLKLVRLTASPSSTPVSYAAISPDGRFVAYTDLTGIHIKNIDTSETKTIPPPFDAATKTPPPASDANLPVAWFPDGTRLLVNTRSQPSIWSVSILTGRALKLRDGGWGSSVSPDGTQIAFVQNEKELWLMGLHGEEPRRLATAELDEQLGRAVWSPDSRRVAYTRVHFRPILECAIESRRVDGGPAIVLLRDARFCQSQAQGFWWSPEGRLIVPIAEPNSARREFNLWEVHPDAETGKPLGEPRRLTNWAGVSLEGITGAFTGKRLAFLRTRFQSQVQIGRFDAKGGQLRVLRRLRTDDDDTGWPTAWTADSRSVVFYSAQSGNNDIYKQDVDKDGVEPLVAGPGDQLTARLSPSGKWFVYMDVSNLQHFGPRTPVRLMRSPATGGPSELVAVSEGYDGHRCSRAPARRCVLGERSADERQLVFYDFDPEDAAPGGATPDRKSVLLSEPIEADRSYSWDLSPDGARIAIAESDEHSITLRVRSFTGAPAYAVKASGWGHHNSMDWSADGRSIYISSRSTSGETLLQIDLQGHVRPLWQQEGAYQTWAVPSPDGRYLALFSASVNCDVWVAEGF